MNEHRSTAAEPIQPFLWHLGSDDGGETWRRLKPGERARLYWSKLGPPEHYSQSEREEWKSPETLEEAIAEAKRSVQTSP
ncbi:MAG TPA: hypothetical protein VEA80_04790 [Vitreimonas sp.]|uniref:hypothetical protein n=1 Tax=Vitreimonas sp. TaxID=3069702 RepID=UPI002D307B3A|nr:hypothetical protein [Vitreimonas sp.]HYD86768.1 hypothetical protein [Vitreimonas sp.]